jgi:hypothetical protein
VKCVARNAMMRRISADPVLPPRDRAWSRAVGPDQVTEDTHEEFYEYGRVDTCKSSQRMEGNCYKRSFDMKAMHIEAGGGWKHQVM